MAFTGFKHTTFKTSAYSVLGVPSYKGRSIQYDDGRRVWQETGRTLHVSRGGALAEAQSITYKRQVELFETACVA